MTHPSAELENRIVTGVHRGRQDDIAIVHCPSGQWPRAGEHAQELKVERVGCYRIPFLKDVMNTVLSRL